MESKTDCLVDKFKEIFESVSDAVFFLDSSLNVIYLNNQAENLIPLIENTNELNKAIPFLKEVLETGKSRKDINCEIKGRNLKVSVFFN